MCLLSFIWSESNVHHPYFFLVHFTFLSFLCLFEQTCQTWRSLTHLVLLLPELKVALRRCLLEFRSWFGGSQIEGPSSEVSSPENEVTVSNDRLSVVKEEKEAVDWLPWSLWRSECSPFKHGSKEVCVFHKGFWPFGEMIRCSHFQS